MHESLSDQEGAQKGSRNTVLPKVCAPLAMTLELSEPLEVPHLCPFAVIMEFYTVLYMKGFYTVLYILFNFCAHVAEQNV